MLFMLSPLILLPTPSREQRERRNQQKEKLLISLAFLLNKFGGNNTKQFCRFARDGGDGGGERDEGKNYTFFNEHPTSGFVVVDVSPLEPKEPFIVVVLAVAFRLSPHNNRSEKKIFVV